MAKKVVNLTIWCICTINKAYIPNLQEDLDKDPEFRELTVFIPTVKILKKNFKGKPIYEEVPALLNYGFVKMPKEKAMELSFLAKVKMHISCISSWVRDNSEMVSEHPILSNYPSTRTERSEFTTGIASENEIKAVTQAIGEISVYSQEDINNLTIGTGVILKGYPFDNIPATITSINTYKKEVGVRMELSKAITNDVVVSFDNIFYTIYSSPHTVDPMKELSIEDLQESRESNHVDNLFIKANYFENPATYGEEN